MNKPTRWFGWNLRTLNVVLFCGGLLTFVVLRIGLDRPIPYVDAVMFHGPSRPVSGGAVESSPIRSDGTFELRAAPGLNFLYVNGQAPQTQIQVDVKAGETVEVQLFIR